MDKWLAEDKPPFGVPHSQCRWFANLHEQLNTILADPSQLASPPDLSRGTRELGTEGGRGTEEEPLARWMRLTLDTIGKKEWPKSSQGEPIYPTGFEELAKKLARPLHPPGRDVYCVVSAGLLPAGTLSHVTHVIGLRPFTSQLQCEMVLGDALRRNTLNVDVLDEQKAGTPARKQEILKVCGIPFEVVPFKANPEQQRPRRSRRHNWALRPPSQ